MVPVFISHLKTASLHVMVRLYENTGIEEDNKEIDCINNDNMVFKKSNFFLPCIFVVRTSKNRGVMFLSEVALGKEYIITKDDCSLKNPPAGYDSVVARGSVEPGTVLLQLALKFTVGHFSVQKLSLGKVFFFFF